MRMLNKDGRIVYSTCSLNPVENEAVVAAVLKSVPGESPFVGPARYPSPRQASSSSTWPTTCLASCTAPG